MKFASFCGYPSWAAVGLLGALAPVALALQFAPAPFSGLTGAAVLLVLILIGADVALGGLGRGVSGALEAPDSLSLGAATTGRLVLSFARAPRGPVEAAFGADSRLRVTPDVSRAAAGPGGPAAQLQIHPLRRGDGRIERVWVRLKGPLGLAWSQWEAAVDHGIFITPDIRPAQRQAARLNARAPAGQKVQLASGAGADFQSLREFQGRGEIRAIDWKRSARHGLLLEKEFHAERNHTIALVFDCGRQMVEPWREAPRLDHALSAGLALAYVGLATGDRVRLFGFDAQVRLATGAASTLAALPALERLTGTLDYSSEATNYTLGLHTVAAQLDRRSIVVVFTEFVDATGAELMLAAVDRLLVRHLVIFVTFRDVELEEMAGRPPEGPADVGRSVIAHSLLDARQAVVERLRRKGVRILETEPDRLDFDLVDLYLDAKRRQLV